MSDLYNFLNRVLSQDCPRIELINKVKELTRLYSKTSDFDVNVKMKISCLLIDWFVKHIQTVDKHLCEFILTQSKMDSGIMAKLKSLLNRFTAKHGEEAEWQ